MLLGASVEEQELLKGVEAIAKVEKKNLTINIQKRIEGITVRPAISRTTSTEANQT